MYVGVLDAADRLARKARGVKVADVGIVSIGRVEQLGTNAQAF